MNEEEPGYFKEFRLKTESNFGEIKQTLNLHTEILDEYTKLFEENTKLHESHTRNLKLQFDAIGEVMEEATKINMKLSKKADDLDVKSLEERVVSLENEVFA